MIDLETKRKLSKYSNFERRSLNLLEFMDNIFGPVPIIPAKLNLPLLMKTGPVLIILPILILL